MGIEQTERRKTMTPEQECSLAGAISEFVGKAEAKYRQGQAEHKGNLWEKSKLIEEMENEVIDQWFYVQALKQKLKSL